MTIPTPINPTTVLEACLADVHAGNWTDGTLGYCGDAPGCALGLIHKHSGLDAMVQHSTSTIAPGRVYPETHIGREGWIWPGVATEAAEFLAEATTGTYGNAYDRVINFNDSIRYDELTDMEESPTMTEPEARPIVAAWFERAIRLAKGEITSPELELVGT